MDFFIPFPFPNFGNGIFNSLPVPKLWEWNFLFPFPFPNPQKSFPLTPGLSINQFPISVILSNLYFQGGVGEDWEQVDPWQDGGFGAGIGSQDRLGDGDRRWRVSLCRGEYCRRCSSLRLLANPK